jgi:hypothetical protein
VWSLRQLDLSVHPTEEARLDAIGHTLACSRIELVLASFRVLEQRTRKLAMVLAVFLLCGRFCSSESEERFCVDA